MPTPAAPRPPTPDYASPAAERRRLLQARWDALPAALRQPTQLAGRTAVACGATHHVMERCNFSCTCCYLGPEANRTAPLPLAEVRRQLDVIRAHLGPGGPVQITAGEVTLLPVDELGAIIAHARSIQLDPMVMTHGQRFLDEPAYLHRLMVAHGLEKISIHIDATQRGRRGVAAGATEAGLNQVRAACARLIREARAHTGRPLTAASTITVTEDNVGALAEVTRWFLANADAFHLLSFLPVAAVGRTQVGAKTAELDDRIWQAVEQAVRRPLNRRALHFGHADCNTTVPLVVARGGGRRAVFECLRAGHPGDARLWAELVVLAEAPFHWSDGLWANLGRLARVGARHPGFCARAAGWALRRLVGAAAPELARVCVGAWRRGERPVFAPFLVVLHQFMSAEELDTDLGRERLAACVFKVPVDGAMISMCEMNARGIRAAIDRRLATPGRPSPLPANFGRRPAPEQGRGAAEAQGGGSRVKAPTLGR